MIKQDNAFIVRVFNTLTGNPTSADLDFLIEAHARVGYLAAIAQGEAETAEAERKFQEATVWRQAKDENPKATSAQIEARVFLDAYEYRTHENRKREEAKKLANLLESVRECINGIKFLGRSDGHNGVRIGP